MITEIKDSFLYFVATDLYQRYDIELSNLNLVFPSQRARLYFTDALVQLIDKPIWQPNYLNIEELIKSLSPLKQIDNYSLLVNLYKIYSKHKQSSESFDHFYFWGEILLNDFDIIDKYLINTDSLFKNLAAQKKLEGDFSFLSQEQIEYIQSFWSTFDPKGQSTLQNQFIDIWSILLPIYNEFKEDLISKGEAYEGMIYRQVAENISKNSLLNLDNTTYVFIGFNALNECEKKLFRYLNNKRKAIFYWDFDDYYINNKVQEAGLFMRNNIQEFAPPESFDLPSLFYDKKEITITSAPSDVLQAKIIPSLLTSMDAALDQKTAIVLADENLLLPVLYSLPNNVDDINITMGYPIKQTPVYSLTELLVQLQRGCRSSLQSARFYHKDVLAILNHQYIKLLIDNSVEPLKNEIQTSNKVYVSSDFFEENGFLKSIFTPITNYSLMIEYLVSIFNTIASVQSIDKNDENALRREYIYYFIKSLNQLKNSIDTAKVQIGLPVFLSLLRNAFTNLRIPFTGEPIKGLQIMGLLETRTLDFENLIILSLNEGVLPKTGTMPSFIPYPLRCGFGLPTIEKQEAIYAYYFYRLLQRAKKVQLVYSSKSDEIRTGEMSRYLYQLKFESKHQIKEQSVNYQISFDDIQPIVIEKTQDVMSNLNDYLGMNAQRSLSPSALSSYIKCPLQFYFRYIAHISETEEVQEELAANVFGSILHSVMEKLYAPYVGKILTSNLIESLRKSKDQIYLYLDEAFSHEFYHSSNLPADFNENGKLLIARDVIAKYLQGILSYDAQIAPFTLVSFEERITSNYTFLCNGQEQSVKLSGFADRIDFKDGILRIIDYKTGGGKGKDKRMKFKGVDSLFSLNPNERNGEVFQTFLYALIYTQSADKTYPIKPTLYFVRDMFELDYNASIVDESIKKTVDNFTPYLNDFTTLLNNCLSDLFNVNIPFTQTIYTDICKKSCAFCQLCRR